MKRILPLIILAVMALTFTSCATLFTGTTQSVTIDSQPQGANIVIDGQLVGTTPARVRLDRDLNAIFDDGKYIRLEKDGYVPDGYILGADIEPFSVLNMFNVFFWAVDGATGALMRYDSDYYNFLLVPFVYNQPTNNPALGSQSSTYPSASSGAQQAEEEAEIDDYEKLMKLVELYEEGLITEEEFEKEKAKIFEK
ncbi:PEGA domain-containing protein [Bacteroidota bacterium]